MNCRGKETLLQADPSPVLSLQERLIAATARPLSLPPPRRATPAALLGVPEQNLMNGTRLFQVKLVQVFVERTFLFFRVIRAGRV